MADGDRFAALLSAGEGRYSLAEACLLLAEDAYPGLDVNRYLAEIERIAARLRGRLSQGADGEERVIALNQCLFNELGFYGNADEVGVFETQEGGIETVTVTSAAGVSEDADADRLGSAGAHGQ